MKTLVSTCWGNGRWFYACILMCCAFLRCTSNHDAKRLYDDLLRKHKYNKLIRPVGNSSDKLTVKIGLKLSQVLEVNERDQMMTTNMWVIQQWEDCGLRWNPEEYGGVKTLYVPSESIWLPDIVLYNNADGDYTVTLMTKATLTWNGMVLWEPPVVYKSYCEIEVEFFPFDQQDCHLKFGSWTYDGFQVDLVHRWQQQLGVDEVAPISHAIDLSEFYPSVAWDLMGTPAKKTNKNYPCCPEPYPDITFRLVLRRKTLFFTINLLIPCISINLLTILGFYLPSDAGEKISLSISILLSLSIFQLLLMEIVPATSVTIPLMGKYILFTSVLVSVSIFSSVVTLNINIRSVGQARMSYITRVLFLGVLPRILFMRKPKEELSDEPVDWSYGQSELWYCANPYKKKFNRIVSVEGTSSTSPFMHDERTGMTNFCFACAQRRQRNFPPSARRAMEAAMFIAKHLQSDDESKMERDEWRYVAQVVDRVLLYVYVIVCAVGGLTLLLRAPSLYDYKKPILGVTD